METPLLDYYSKGDISLIKQFLLTFPIFNEIHYFIGNEKFYQFLKCIQVHPVLFTTPFQLSQSSTYLFMPTGLLIPKKQKNLNFYRFNKLSKAMKFSNSTLNKDIYNQENQRQSQKIKTTANNELYNLRLLYNQNQSSQSHIFLSNEDKKSAIIQVNLSQIPQPILNELREKHNQKLKFIGNCDLFRNVQRYLVEKKLSKFHLLRVSFDEFLIKQPSLRTNHVFFLISGEVQILVNENEMKKTYLTKTPAIIGLEKIKSVKSVTECCECFFIEKSQIIDILKKNSEGKYKNPQTQQHLKSLLTSMNHQKLFSRAQHTSKSKCVDISQSIHHSSILSPRNQSPSSTPIQSTKNKKTETSVLKQKKNLIKAIQQRIPEKKRYRIKEHFTNFLNDRFSEFVVKKTEFFKKICQKDDSILYEMKALKPKQPQMSQINNRLRMQRLNRLQKCKENITVTKQESLNMVNLRMYEEFEDSKIIRKIRRKIQLNIDQKQRKNKHWKTYMPNTASFNRMSDLSFQN